MDAVNNINEASSTVADDGLSVGTISSSSSSSSWSSRPVVATDDETQVRILVSPSLKIDLPTTLTMSTEGSHDTMKYSQKYVEALESQIDAQQSQFGALKSQIVAQQCVIAAQQSVIKELQKMLRSSSPPSSSPGRRLKSDRSTNAVVGGSDSSSGSRSQKQSTVNTDDAQEVMTAFHGTNLRNLAAAVAGQIKPSEMVENYPQDPSLPRNPVSEMETGKVAYLIKLFETKEE